MTKANNEALENTKNFIMRFFDVPEEDRDMVAVAVVSYISGITNQLTLPEKERA